MNYVPKLVWVDANGFISSSKKGELYDSEEVQSRWNEADDVPYDEATTEQQVAAEDGSDEILSTTSAGLVGAGAAVAVILSPCAVPLIPAILGIEGVASETRRTDEVERRILKKVLPFTSGLTLSITVLILLISLVGTWIGSYMPILARVAILFAGAIAISMILGKTSWLSRLIPSNLDSDLESKTAVGIGMSYGVIGLGCSAPMLLIISSLAIAGQWIPIIIFLPTLAVLSATFVGIFTYWSDFIQRMQVRYSPRRIEVFNGMIVILVISLVIIRAPSMYLPWL